MPNPPLARSKLIEVALLIEKHGSVQGAAKENAERLGINASSFESRAKMAKHAGLWDWNDRRIPFATDAAKRDAGVPTAPALPDDDIAPRDLVSMLRKRFTKRKANADARLWRRFDVPVTGPYGLMLWGDPHLDDNGCDWNLVTLHAELCAKNKHIYSVNIGDTTNNWAGALVKLWANQDTSSSTARKLVKWFLNDSGIKWFLWLQGNHDLWPGPVGGETLERFKPAHVALEDWGAKVTLVSPGGSEFRLHASHDFPGHSQWNPLHGPQKSALMGDQAHLYAAGHKHNWALYQSEHEHRKSVYWLARSRGYKAIDDYATLHGYGSQDHGHSIMAVVDPGSEGPSHVQCFADPIEGADYLAFKRRRA
ncbi:hypothetical protein UFOVP119_48 [uncultured Caudovirales phage]|uniref:Uncharacterized protein n=1 Tax=uncultured Caudovirales phage TaxID=2100421 RepID=A0A6J5L7J5_9CAUD|nr:hypothetical protein UFOVP119_48 [uncultured Caudovirales phage]